MIARGMRTYCAGQAVRFGTAVDLPASRGRAGLTLALPPALILLGASFLVVLPSFLFLPSCLA